MRLRMVACSSGCKRASVHAAIRDMRCYGVGDQLLMQEGGAYWIEFDVADDMHRDAGQFQTRSTGLGTASEERCQVLQLSSIYGPGRRCTPLFSVGILFNTLRPSLQRPPTVPASHPSGVSPSTRRMASRRRLRGRRPCSCRCPVRWRLREANWGQADFRPPHATTVNNQKTGFTISGRPQG